MAKKGMSYGIKVLFAVIAIMVVVLVMLAIFSGGAQNIGQTINTWIGGVPDKPQACSSYAQADCGFFAGCQWCGTGTAKAGTCISLTEACGTK